jgi:hypothetical protein
MNEELLKQILSKLDHMESEITDIKTAVTRIDSKMDTQHMENIRADEKLLEAIRTTNDRLDFHRNKVSIMEEDIHLLKQRQQ